MLVKQVRSFEQYSFDLLNHLNTQLYAYSLSVEANKDYCKKITNNLDIQPPNYYIIYTSSFISRSKSLSEEEL